MVLRLLLACVVWFAAIGAAFPKSVTGKHCPTAPVQIVVRSRPATGCCSGGTQQGHVELFTPQPGEAHFQQCLCADKRSKQVENGFEFGTTSLPAILTAFPSIDLPLEPVSKEPPTAGSCLVPTTTRQPSVPPPNAF